MTNATFTPGQTYTVKGNVTVTITRRTEKSVWFMNWDGTEVRRKVETDTFLNTEFVRYDERNVANACDVVTETTETVTEAIETVETETTEATTEVIETATEINPLPEAEYEAIRETLVTRFYKINDKLAAEKRARYFYVTRQGGTDTTSYDVAIADYRAKLKDLDTKIKELDLNQGLELDPLD